MAHPDSIVQVLLFKDAEKSVELGPPLWAAFKELEEFYNRAMPPRSYHRFYLAERVPVAVQAEMVPDPMSEAWGRIAAELGSDTFWATARGRYIRTFDQDKLGARVRDLLMRLANDNPESFKWLGSPGPADPDVTSLSKQLREGYLLLVTDQEITPPPEWRYIIWDDCRNGSVVSIAPTDPHHWRERDEARIATIKHRVRTACLSVLGEQFGFGRCNNPMCFLHQDVNSVTDLDQMVFLGPEHHLPQLSFHGFAPRPDEPTEVQPIIPKPAPAGESGPYE